jgi:hypothetical protein
MALERWEAELVWAMCVSNLLNIAHAEKRRTAETEPETMKSPVLYHYTRAHILSGVCYNSLYNYLVKFMQIQANIK